MGNDPVNKSNEEEYQFIDSEHSTNNFESMTQKKSTATLNPGPSEGKKKIFLLIGALVAIFCLYKLVDVFSASPAKSKAQMPAVSTKAAPAVVEQPKPVVEQQPSSTLEAAASSEPVVQSPAAPVNTLQDKVGTLERVVSKVSESNANLQYQMAGVATSIADIQNNLSTMSQQLADLTKAKEKTAETPKTQEKASTGVKKSKTRSKSKIIAAVSKKSKVSRPNKASYYIKAMIQGRAWLITPEGASTTVSVGDNLPGYGGISNIDVDKGEVSTSSGAVIGYKSDDR